MSREPHPGFYGFGQPDSLKERQEYIRLASVELQFEIPWIIDNMENTLQKTYGGMPNMEFVIGPDGTLLASWDWANPNKLKQFLEENVGPSGITEEEWQEFSQKRRPRISMRDNDEVPGTQVPHSELAPLEVEPLSESDGNSLIALKAGTLPPNVTPSGQSRLYLTIQPKPESGAHFDNAEGAVIHLSEAKGIELKKDKLVAGRLMSKEKDVNPHTLGVNWTLDESEGNMEFTATVVVKMGVGEEPAQEKTAKFRIVGAIPVRIQSMDEILADQLPSKKQLKKLKCVASYPEDVPFDVEAFVQVDRSDPKKGTGYLILRLDKSSGYKWNNLSDTQKVGIKPVSGIKFDKETLAAGKRDFEEDTDDRILKFNLMLEPGAKQIVFEVTPEAWVCHAKQGWCREFVVPFKVTGKL